MSPESETALRELVIATVAQFDGRTRDDAERLVDSGAISVHVSGDTEAYFARWNAWYDALTDEQQDAYHHEETSFCEDGTCEQCALLETLGEPHCGETAS